MLLRFTWIEFGVEWLLDTSSWALVFVLKVFSLPGHNMISVSIIFLGYAMGSDNIVVPRHILSILSQCISALFFLWIIFERSIYSFESTY